MGDQDEFSNEQRTEGRSAERLKEDQRGESREDRNLSLDGLVEKIRNRGENADARLKGHLAGNIKLEITDRRAHFDLPWGNADSGTECTISLSENSLRRIIAGELNPQIGMVSDKIRVGGRAELAMYFFNIVAER